MDQKEFGKLIKEIRKKNNLTQKDFANKYNVTYQAVSKWENGKNMPDVSLIKEISKDFNVSIDDLLEGRYTTKNNGNYIKWVILVIVIAILSILIIIILNNRNDFVFKTLSSNCDNFNISGSISYNNNKSAIYITNITYCGEEDSTIYKKIECSLYEKNNNINTKINSYIYDDSITLSEFLKRVTFSTDNYSKICREYTENSLYLEIDCTNEKDIVTSYSIPLSFNDDCK